MSAKTFMVPNIHCKHCTMTIQRELGALAGVTRVSVDVDTKEVTVEWEAPATWDAIEALLKEIHYPPAE